LAGPPRNTGRVSTRGGCEIASTVDEAGYTGPIDRVTQEPCGFIPQLLFDLLMLRPLLLAACVAVSASHVALAQVRQDSESAVKPAAPSEAELVVYGSTSQRFARYLIDGFKALYPTIAVKYVSIPARELDSRLRRDAGTVNGPDIVWSSAMDEQMRAALDGYAQRYRSPEAANIPAWGKWRDQLYATTYEPIVLAYNRRLLPAAEVPKTHDALRERLNANPQMYHGRISTYDTRNDEVGILPFRLDAIRFSQFWGLIQAMRAADADWQSASASILDSISAGRTLIAYNIAGTEAIRRARRDPLVGVQFTMDYTLVASRVMFIAKQAPHPNAARLWVDYVLSKEGQQQLQVADITPIREDVKGVDPGIVLLRRTGSIAKPIALNAELERLSVSNTAAAEFAKRLRTMGSPVTGTEDWNARTSVAHWNPEDVRFR
jgi:iron(III) transport system substrate-binding protein